VSSEKPFDGRINDVFFLLYYRDAEAVFALLEKLVKLIVEGKREANRSHVCGRRARRSAR
jgi:hypothetical protein